VPCKGFGCVKLMFRNLGKHYLTDFLKKGISPTIMSILGVNPAISTAINLIP
jgi:hypothetical protein